MNKSYKERLLDLSVSTSIAELDAKFQSLVALWGFERWGAVPVIGPRGGAIDPISLALGTPSSEWRAHYSENAYHRHDAVIQALRDCEDPIWWTEFVKKRPLTAVQRRIFDEAREHGIAEGLSIATGFVDGSVWICALTGLKAKPHQEITVIARAATDVYLRRARSIRRPITVTPRSYLTHRQLEIVRLLSRGASAEAAAGALSIKPRTVYNQIGIAKERLEVRTQSELISRAYELGLIGNT